MWIQNPPSDTTELARLATERAREALPGVDIEIYHDRGLWIRRVGKDYFPDPEIWKPDEPNWTRWAGTAAKFVKDVNDYWFHVYHPKPGDVIVDIGAGRGEDVFVFSRAVGPEGHVWAVEPHPVSYKALKKLCELNKLTNVTPLNYACVEEPSHLQIETLPVWESNYIRSGDPAPTSFPVEGVRFDDLRLGRIDYLKMNIEGAERFALPGCEKSLALIPFTTVAAHDFRAARGEGEEFRTLAFVRGFLTRSGFQLKTRDDDPRYYVPYHVHGSR